MCNRQLIRATRLWADAVSKSPRRARPHANLATSLLRDGRIDEAILHYCEALAIDPQHPHVRRNLEIALQQELDAQEETDEDGGIDVTVNERGEIVFDLVARCRDKGVAVATPP